MIDFVVVAHRARHLLPANSIKADFAAVEGAGKAHYGQDISLNFDSALAQGWILQRPRSFEHPGKPRKAPDPESKRSKSRAAAQAAREAVPRTFEEVPPSWGPRARITIKSPPALKYLHLEFEDEDDFVTDDEAEVPTDVPDDLAPQVE